ncbi:Transmembrane protein [Trichostrongylus colubriformis]|uniref:Transmembrane protein n=1 Tax=Trichostrongylus colubriformis TaxID=6319 RepID=A0AAN8IJR0_TRICO
MRERNITMSLDVEDRTEDIKNNNRKLKPTVHFTDPAKRCHYCGREEKKPETEKKKTNNGFYLGIILGNNINLTMSSTERFYFKKDYENFKLRFTIFNLFPLAIAYFFPSRPMDSICHFLMVWYYCTLTIRESILIINGSKLGPWWIAHHYLACVIGGVALTWPDDAAYKAFHSQFLLFAGYICLVQQLQYQYQNGCLRRLHSLGHGDSMDVTLEGFATWMFQGLTFLLPFLAVIYLMELNNAYTLFILWRTQECTWQVPALSILFLIVGVGNIAMVSQIVFKRMKEKGNVNVRKILQRYPSMAHIH